MRTLGALEARYADDHVPLALVLGAIGALSTVRRLLRVKPVVHAAAGTVISTNVEEAGTEPELDSFAALLLGVVATHDRLLGLFGPTLAEHRDGDGTAASGDDPHSLEGLLR